MIRSGWKTDLTEKLTQEKRVLKNLKIKYIVDLLQSTVVYICYCINNAHPNIILCTNIMVHIEKLYSIFINIFIFEYLETMF